MTTTQITPTLENDQLDETKQTAPELASLIADYGVEALERWLDEVKAPTDIKALFADILILERYAADSGPSSWIASHGALETLNDAAHRIVALGGEFLSPAGYIVNRLRKEAAQP